MEQVARTSVFEVRGPEVSTMLVAERRRGGTRRRHNAALEKSTGTRSPPGWRRAKLCDLGRHDGEAGKLVRAQDERVSKESQLSGMKMPPLNEHDGRSLNAEPRSAPVGAQKNSFSMLAIGRNSRLGVLGSSMKPYFL